jgi:hypothetical protein
MLMDQNLVLSAAQAVTATAASTNTIDLLQGLAIATGAGTYPVPPNAIIGNATFFGEDLGLGRGKGEPVFVVTTGSGTPAAATSLQIAVQGAVDNGGGTIAGLTFVPYIETRAIPLASIAASTRIATIAWPRREQGQGLPRFINLNYIVVGAAFTGLTLSADITLGPDTAQGTLGQYPANY